MQTTTLGFAKAEDLLARRISAGDPEAIGSVYDRHHLTIRRFAQRLVGDEDIAEDLVHDVFVTLPKAIQGFRGASSLRTFLISIAANHARHHVRAAGRRRAAMSRLGQQPAPRDPATPEDETTRRRLAELLVHALDQLPLEKRLAFVLCAVEERSSTEVAEIVGAPEATVRTRVFHARRKLCEILSGGSRSAESVDRALVPRGLPSTRAHRLAEGGVVNQLTEGARERGAPGFTIVDLG